MERDPSIFDYMHYRQYLRDKIAFLRSKELYSVRAFAEKAGLNCSGLMGRILSGKRSLTLKTAKRISKGLEHSKAEADFLLELVRLERAASAPEQESIAQKIIRSKAYLKFKGLDAYHSLFFGSWLNIALLAALGAGWSSKKTEALSRGLGVRPQMIKDSLDLLKKLKLVKYVEGNWVPSDTALSTEAETNDLLVRKFHREMIQKALQSVDEASVAERDLEAVTISVSPKTYNKIKKDIFDFTGKLIAQYSESDEVDQDVYQVNVQFFPLLKNR
jgi:uncharacterized protein (TIGR02147 family)